MDGFINIIRNRRSIRAYTTQPVAREIIEDVVNCARLAPTAMNVQPWDFVVIQDKKALASLPPLLGHAEFFTQAAFAVLVFAHDDAPFGLEDCCAATENLLLAASAHGLGSCWVAGSRQPYAKKVAAAFGAPADQQLVSLISFGYPAEIPQVEKKPLTEVLHWEHF